MASLAIDSIRAFLAFSLPDDIIDTIRGAQRCLKDQGIRIAWVKPENVHLTLRFLGEISPEAVRLVMGAAAATAAGAAPMTLTIKGLGVFPDARRPRVVWAGLGGRAQSLIDFQSGLEENLANVGFEKEQRRFTAHLTLGRIKKPIPPAKVISALDACAGLSSREFSADRLVLYKSELRPEGAAYTVLQAFPLDG